MEILADIVFEIYGELMFLIIPEKNRSKPYIWLSRLIATAVFLVVISLAIWGVVLMADYNNPWGMIPLGVAVVISLVQITAGILLYKRNH